jgi:hypothetical protein
MVSSVKPIEECGSASTVMGDSALGCGVYLRIASGSGLSNFFTRADIILTRLHVGFTSMIQLMLFGRLRSVRSTLVLLEVF